MISRGNAYSDNVSCLKITLQLSAVIASMTVYHCFSIPVVQIVCYPVPLTVVCHGISKNMEFDLHTVSKKADNCVASSVILHTSERE